MRRKAPQLTLAKRQQIGRYKEKFPTATIAVIAEQFNCSYNQARNAINDYKSGKLHRTKPRAKYKSIEEVKEKYTPDELLELQFHKSLAHLEKDAQIATDERIKLLEMLFSMRRILQNIRLESHIKRVDAGVIKEIIRKFIPDATDESVIKIYLEAVERWKANQ